MFSTDLPGIITPQLGERTLPGIDMIVMILSCAKTVDRREACLETWLQHGVTDKTKYVFLIGRPGQEPALCGDILYVDAPDTYLGLPHKVWAGIRECLLRWDFRYLVKLDDDSWGNLTRLHAYPKSNDYIGRAVAVNGEFDPSWHEGKCLYGGSKRSVNRQSYRLSGIEHTPYVGPWAGGGCGYILSRRAARLIAREPLSHVLRESYEDKMVGDIMASYNIRLFGQHNTFRALPQRAGKAITLGGILGATTIHQLSPPQMREVYWRLLRAGEIST